MTKRLALLPLILVCMAATKASAAEIPLNAKSELTIQISGARSDEGRLMLALFDSKESFTKNATRSVVLRIAKRSATWKANSIRPGTYAIALYHDENGNGRMDKNFVGIPREDYAFSRGAKASFGPPRWLAAAFVVRTGRNVQSITLSAK
jgi:uncharacterized protein (DUF2141 family)